MSFHPHAPITMDPSAISIGDRGYYALYQNRVGIYIPVTVKAVHANGRLYILADDLETHFPTVEGMRTGVWIDPEEFHRAISYPDAGEILQRERTQAVSYSLPVKTGKE